MSRRRNCSSLPCFTLMLVFSKSTTQEICIDSFLRTASILHPAVVTKKPLNLRFLEILLDNCTYDGLIFFWYSPSTLRTAATDKLSAIHMTKEIISYQVRAFFEALQIKSIVGILEGRLA
ncbi:hypothetical protein GGS23DRAFT_97563 [Durotheca rogersii]|uniref:uncharacterized protein n=1 Tax=Durotheca rogersii TaxID=419775 RepID=UPI00221F3C15|nr:uncharacterized protein GGS23DRAFT_97563 [Durotheca rogersii]KAI5862373.1 hypothetical protein GGS23DRAFT_97563 [Durotheca rogersii]